jgi:CMP-N,N'-diacetyllegionaminic acid synthase
MIGSRRVLAVIPARGGSKGLPGKNIRPVDGRPLLAWTIEAAQRARTVDRVVLSSDDAAIMSVARSLGCDVPFRRPNDLATDVATSVDVVLHALDELPEFDTVLLLQPTSPLRLAADIDAAYERFETSGAETCVSVAPVEQHPFWMYFVGENHALNPVLSTPDVVTRRQELPPVFALNGAIYIADVAALRRSRSFITSHTVAYVMPLARSLDIDTAADFEQFRSAVAKDSDD